MGYTSYDLSKVPAVKYEVDNEPIARDWYAKEMISFHQNFTCMVSGFYIGRMKSFLGASYDGIICCSCCGNGILEIKWSFKNKVISKQEAANVDKTFCFDSALILKTSHIYYSQVQFQMLNNNKLCCVISFY